MFLGITSVENVRTALLDITLVVLMMGRPRKILILWNWFLSIYGGPPEYNLLGERYTSCLSWMRDHHTNMVLTSQTSLTLLQLRPLMYFESRPNHCRSVKFAVFALIEHTIHLPGRIIANAMGSYTSLLHHTLLRKTD